MVKRQACETGKVVALFTGLYLKLYLDRHHQSKLKLKFNLCLSNFCQQNFQNIVTWGVELQSCNTIFACFSMESLISGVLPYCCMLINSHKLLSA